MSRKWKFRGMRIELNHNVLERAVKNASASAIRSALEHVAEESRRQVPVDTGRLRASCTVSVDESKKAGVVSYDTPYAIDQHENMSYAHWHGGKAKYLEDPVWSLTYDVKHIAADAFREELR